MHGVSQKYLLEEFHEIVMKDNFWKYMNFTVPGPHDLGLIPDDDDNEEEEEIILEKDPKKEENSKIIDNIKIYEEEEREEEESDDEPPYTFETNIKDLGNIISSIYSMLVNKYYL